MDAATIALLIFAFLAGAACYHLLYVYVFPNWRYIYSWGFLLRRDGRLGAPCKADKVLDRKGYSVGYSYEHKAPLWVSYVQSKVSAKIDKDRSPRFYVDTDLPEAHRVKPSDFTHSGYDKGHLAPADAVDFSHKSAEETFYMSNVAFQHAQLNRQAWRSLENKAEAWTEDIGKLYIVTGPLFGERPKRYNDIAIPRAFYKIIYASKQGKSIGFVFPNAAVKTDDLWDYAMPIAQIEADTGYSFMDKLSRRKRKVKHELDLEWWQNI